MEFAFLSAEWLGTPAWLWLAVLDAAAALLAGVAVLSLLRTGKNGAAAQPRPLA